MEITEQAPPVPQAEIERRYPIGTVELRAEGDGDNATKVVRGYALKFDVYYDMEFFEEVVRREAFKNAKMDDVVVLLNHDPNIILGRTSAGTAKIGIDEVGLWYEATLPDSPNGHNARTAIERGDVKQSSWAFTLLHDDAGEGATWERNPNGKWTREIKRIKRVYDVSPVTYPANPDTSVALRSMKIKEQEAQLLSPDNSNTTAGRADYKYRLRLAQTRLKQ